MWYEYDTAKPVAKKIKGVTKKESKNEPAGVVLHPISGIKIYWA